MSESAHKVQACRFCKRGGVRFVNAHVIARSFFKIVRGNAKYSVRMEAKGTSLRTPYHQAGVADASILCEDCEPKFTKWDTYGFEILSISRGEADAIRASDGSPMAIPIDDLNYELFILFFLSVLWRASVSSLEFYKTVDLGRYEEPIRDLLWSRKAPQPSEYAALLGASLNQPYPNVILRPERCRLEGIHFNRLFFPNVFVHLKSDRREATPLMKLTILQPRKTNYIFCFPYTRSPYLRFFEGLKKRILEIEM